MKAPRHPLIGLLYGLCMVAIGSLTACERAMESPTGPSDDFGDFYRRFLSDADYQLAHITFPLEGLPPSATEADLGSFYWQREDWQIHRPFDPEATGFKTEFIPIGKDVMVERITHKDKAYGMMRRYARLGDDWYLIYYAGLNELSQ